MQVQEKPTKKFLLVQNQMILILKRSSVKVNILLTHWWVCAPFKVGFIYRLHVSGCKSSLKTTELKKYSFLATKICKISNLFWESISKDSNMLQGKSS